MFGIIIFIIFLLLVLGAVSSCVKVVPQAKAYVVERLGAYRVTWSTGLHFKAPFIERVGKEGESEGAGGGFSAPAGYHQG